MDMNTSTQKLTYREIALRRQPFVLVNAAVRKWKALRSWTTDFFESLLPAPITGNTATTLLHCSLLSVLTCTVPVYRSTQSVFITHHEGKHDDH